MSYIFPPADRKFGGRDVRKRDYIVHVYNGGFCEELIFIRAEHMEDVKNLASRAGLEENKERAEDNRPPLWWDVKAASLYDLQLARAGAIPTFSI